MKFHDIRRQQFLTERGFLGTKQFFETIAAPSYLEKFRDPGSDDDDRRRVTNAYADETFALFLLRYTAGESLIALRGDLETVINAYAQATRHIRAYAKDERYPPLQFVEIDEYERVLQMISLCYLLHRRELLPRIAAMIDPGSANEDTLYEDLLAYELDDRYDVDTWNHEAPYGDLINSQYRDTAEESIQDIQKYLKNWYHSLNRAPWYNSHLNMDGEYCGAYFGYWAIEAGAVAYLLDLDDSSFRENLVYPKHLVDFARESTGNENRDLFGDVEKPQLVKGGAPCPLHGYWETPAAQNSRAYFSAGDIMPNIRDSFYGETFWQWSNEQ